MKIKIKDIIYAGLVVLLFKISKKIILMIM